MKRRLPCLAILLALSCRANVPSAPSSPGSENPAPTNVEILAYLEDKPLPGVRLGGKPLAMRLEGIEALSVRRDSIRIDGGPWRTGISFIYNTWRARYAVEAIVVHETIGAQRVFHALHVQRMIAV
jgi:hypothetical protein